MAMHRWLRSAAPALILALAGCNLSSYMPWPSREAREQSTVPRDAKGYVCESSKRLYVRYASDGKSAMVIFPDREFRLDRVGTAAGERYSNGHVTLLVQGDQVALDDSGATPYAGCKPEAAAR